jgi:hypothetical protein
MMMSVPNEIITGRPPNTSKKCTACTNFLTSHLVSEAVWKVIPVQLRNTQFAIHYPERVCSLSNARPSLFVRTNLAL